MDWQPIETAPENGEIILWNGEEVVAGRKSYSLGWAASLECGDEDGLPLFPPPTHWMPLPEPPAIADTHPKGQDAEERLGS